jgi:ectoine hydroxylase-related dioxygenase (phytanoyl-CoA dioxygenase family)
MAAGSVMIFHGSLWHGGGATSRPTDRRLGVNVQYCPGFVRQQQNPYSASRPRWRPGSPIGSSACSATGSTRA